MARSMRPYERSASRAARRRRARRRRRVLVAAAALIACAGTGALVWAIVADGRGAAAAPLSTTQLHPSPARVVYVAARPPLHLAEHPAGRLPFAIQDPAAVSLPGGGIALLGGLGATDLSLNEALLVRRGSSHALGHLPRALHDAPGARIGGRIFVFGGGDGIRQLDAITRRRCRDGTHVPGRLPARGELRQRGRDDRQDRLRRRWVHGDEVARHDRRLESRPPRADRRAPPVARPLRRGHRGARCRRDRGRIAAGRHREPPDLDVRPAHEPGSHDRPDARRHDARRGGRRSGTSPT